MHFGRALLLISMAALARAAGKFSVKDLPSGGYRLALDESGNQVTNPISPPPHPSQSSPKFRRRTSTLSARAALPPTLQTLCRDDGVYNRDDIVTAKLDLFAWCDAGNQIGAGGSVAFVVGDAVYYACSNGGVNPCSSGEINQADNVMNAQCGEWTDVNLWIPDWAKTYGRSTAGHVC